MYIYLIHLNKHFFKRVLKVLNKLNLQVFFFFFDKNMNIDTDDTSSGSKLKNVKYTSDYLESIKIKKKETGIFLNRFFFFTLKKVLLRRSIKFNTFIKYYIN